MAISDEGFSSKSLSTFAIEGREVDSSGIRSADAFQQLSPRSQARQKPGMWVGSILPDLCSVYTFDGNKIRKKEIPDYIDAIERFMLEILSNAVDNCTYSIHCGRRPDEISIDIDEKEISVTNGGCNVPVEKNSSGEWIPSMLWGSLFSSSHYEEAKRKYKQSSCSSGTNGVGAALVNIFSENFYVKVEDPISKNRYTNEWSRGKPIEGVECVEHDPKIKDTLITVKWTLDFPFFNIPKYSDTILELLAFHAVTASFMAKVPVTLNGKRYDLRLLTDYAALFQDFLQEGGEQKTLEYYYLSSSKSSVKSVYVNSLQKNLEIPQIELLLVDEQFSKSSVDPIKKTTQAAVKKTNASILSTVQQIAFTNGIMNRFGGCHVDQMIQTFWGDILAELGVTNKQGKKFVSFILSVHVLDPSFKGQNKEILLAPKPVFENVTPAMLKSLRIWDIVGRFQQLTEFDKLLALKKSDGKKVRHLANLNNLDDANDAGTSKSHLCTLIIVEGDSAAVYPENLRNCIPDGRDTHGIFKLRGKPINVLNHEETLSDNVVYGKIKQAIGLQDGVDYSVTANFKRLRYGHVLIAADADCDGWHIVGLLILMFALRFPSLMDRGFISFLRTPVLRIRGANGMTFFTKRAFEEWKSTFGGSVAGLEKRIKYYKGLGTSSAAEVKEDYKSGKGELAIADRDQGAKEALDLVFNGDRSDDRKEWLSTGVQGDFLDTEDKIQDIARFVHTGVKIYSLDNIQRAIPSIMDGLKESMRKALVTGITKFGLASGNRNASAGGKKSSKGGGTVFPEAKVFQIVANGTEHLCYHHGEPIFADVTSNMCKDFTGTNNVTWFEPVSCFGTIDTGKSPSPRYASLGPAWWWSYVYSNLDADLVDYVYDEAKKCEPKFLLPVACWVLCNQSDGVGTGYSTKIPGHNIEEVALAHLALLNGRKSFPKLIPWWRGFQGTISVIPRSRARRMVYDKQVHEDDTEGVLNGADGGNTMIANEPMVCVIDGTYIVQGRKVIVTSLPLRTLEDFRKILFELIQKKIVHEFRNLTIDQNIRFEIEMEPDEKTGQLPSGNIMQLFRLRKIIAMTNLVLLDENGLPKKYNSAEHILQTFHDQRIKYYEKRRLSIIEQLGKVVTHLEQKMRLIRLLILGKTDPQNGIAYVERPEDEIFADMAVKVPDIPHKVYNDLHIKHLNKDKIVSLENEIVLANSQLKEIEETTKEEMWKKDLWGFIKEYRAIYGSCLSEPYSMLSKVLAGPPTPQ